MGDTNAVLYALAIVVFPALCYVGFVLKKRHLPLPPGPKGLPLLGSALEINKNEPWLTYKEWKKTYGEIVSCNLLGQTYVIINSERVAKALLEQRSNIYSDRPVIRTSSLFGMDFNTGHKPYGDAWRSHRKIFHQSLNSSIIHKYHESLAEKARILLVNLLQDPDHFEDNMRTYAASIIMSITYGYDIMPKDDPLVGPIEEIMKIVVLLTPERAVLLNLFPQLINFPSWFPGAELHESAERCKELSPKVRNVPFQFVKDCLVKGIDNDSMVAQLLKEETPPGQYREAYEQNIKDCATSSFLGMELNHMLAGLSIDLFLARFDKAGIDTTQSALITLIMALVLNPEVQDRAQTLIDSVVGRDRLPAFSDRSSLQYIDALLRETLRWASLVPMAVPHMVTKDDIFEQYLIPKGSVIIPNLWGMTRDEEKFPDPTAFKPERHLDADGNLFSEDSLALYFGFGRRICPGRYLTNASTWLAAANMLSMFRFSKAIGPAGYELDFPPKFTGGVALRPVPFPCHITPRFEGAKELLDQVVAH